MADKNSTTPPTEQTVLVKAENGEEATPSTQGKKPPYLLIIEGPHTGAYFPLTEEKNIIGRGAGSVAQLPDHSVSRSHAEIKKTEAGWLVQDLGSKNGTLVNGNLISEAVVVGHKDVIKTGIYYLRLITQVISHEEEMVMPEAVAVSESTVMAQSSVPEEMAEEEQEEFSEHEANLLVAEGRSKTPPARSRIRKILFTGFAGLFIIGCVGYLTWKFFLHPQPTKVAKAPSSAAARPIEQPKEIAAEEVGPVAPQTVPVFLDFASSPLPATVTFQEKEIGQTPIRVNLELEPSKSYTAQALFHMPELNEYYTLPVNFEFAPDESVVPILFRAPIGMIKVDDLPADVQFYLEGSFEYDKFKEKPAKLNEIVLKKPIYIPYGKYMIELRRSRQLGESQTYVQDIIFKREFTIAEDQPTFTLTVLDEDLKKFPVQIKSDPTGADVFIDGKPMGQTPYEGDFPLGDHTLTLRKEGYFEHSQKLSVDINTLFTTDIKLETSVAGAYLNNAKSMINRELYQEAVNELAQALASEPAPSEVAQANYYLGMCYLNLKQIDKALNYFNLAKQTEEWKYFAILGEVAAYAASERTNLALPLLVEVMLNAKDEEVQKQANDLFQNISPLRSIIYAYTEPAGARVIVNDKPVENPTPVILHDLPLGTYRIRFEKPGYQPLELKLTLNVNEFNPVIVTLKPVAE
ncbi:MAG: PEGA domain-containing protein [Pseudomonadota bacterium]